MFTTPSPIWWKRYLLVVNWLLMSPSNVKCSLQRPEHVISSQFLRMLREHLDLMGSCTDLVDNGVQVYKFTEFQCFDDIHTAAKFSSVFHCLKKCSPHFALNWWVCIAKVGYYKHCSHHRFRNRFIRENAN